MKRIFTAFMMMLCAACVASAANYLTFTAEEDSSTFGIVNNKNTPDVQYSLDGGETWATLAGGDTVTLAHKGDKALLKGNNPEGFSKNYDQYSSFKMTGKVAASGSVMSLIDGMGLSTEIPNGCCFCRLFRNCTSLTQAPELPATTLAISCYEYMFYGCTSLTKAPELPATTLVVTCYLSMFSDCVSLTSADLSFEQYVGERSCCNDMFRGCTNLTEIKVSFEEWGYGNLENPRWVENVAPTGTFICPKGLPLEYGVNRIPEGWTVKYIDDTVAAETNYLTFTAEEDGSTFGIVNNGGNNPDIQYSLDGGETWIALAAGDTITLAHKGDKALLRGDNPEGFSKDTKKYSSFTMTGMIAASGSVMSLIDGVGETLVIPANYCFYNLFVGCKSLTKAPELPATTLAERCYDGMFERCTNLTHAPALPATTLADGCYMYMFSGCTSLKQAPELPAMTLAERCYLAMFASCKSLTQAPALPATTLAEYCYNRMFSGCESLTQAPELPATTLAENCYASMFSGCTSLTKAPELPATTLAERCYLAMFASCKSLTQAPALPATTLANYCYCEMFRDCTSLTQAPELPATTLAEGCYTSMFQGCTSLTQAPALPATTLPAESNVESGCYSNMFSGCTSLTQAPALPATTLADFCYSSMFRGCTSLSQIRVSFDDWNDGLHTDRWVKDVAPTGTFICPKALALEYGEDRIPEGWTVQYVEDLNYLTFTAEEDGSTFGIVNGRNSPNVLYSLDGGKTWTFLAEGDTVRLAHKGDKALLKGNNPQGFSRNRMEYQSSFKMTGKIAASGSVMSLIDGTGLSSEIRGVECFGSLFENCTSLTQAPELPATTLTEDCYYGMFRGCTGLTLAPELPATTLADWCYRAMFEGCTGLIQAPELPATTLVSGCYSEMFRGCTGLTQAPALPATTLAEYCYYEMFRGCTSLSKAPALPATTLAEYCYSDMFSSCTSLTEAPELPATTLANNCYAWMFSGCTSLTKAPNLPATELPAPVNKNFCYGSMFLNCTNLSEISVAFTEWDANTARWVADVAPTGTFICPKALPLEYGEDRIPEGWTVKYIDDTVAVDDTVVVEANYLTFTAEEDNSTFGIKNTNNEPDVQYSLDGGKTWTALADGDSIVLAKKGDKALLKGNNPKGFSHDYLNCTQFVMSGSISASGSVMSLIDGVGLSVTIPCDYCFHSMFSGCTSLAQAPELPATALAGNCYWSMFSGCTSLVQAPELPATTLAGHCYAYMFKECTSLTQAPELPATTLALRCYEQMFSGCTSLTQVSALPATTLDSYCYVYMFSGCTSLTKAPELPATTLDSCCYAYMFSGCTSLTQTPELPATTLADRCYYSMFKGCTGLMRASELPATTLASGCYSTMFSDCTNLTQYPELPATTLADRCYHSMFSGCTGLTEAPALPATTLANNCYYSMFSGCTSLTKAPKLPATDLPIPSGKSSCCGSMFSGCTNLSEISVAFNEWNDNTFEWVKDVAPAGTFICPEDLPVRYGMSRIPRGWAAKNIIDGDTVDVPINYNYLTFTAEEDGSTFGIDCYLLEADVQYSLDGGNTWTKLALGDTVVLAQKGDKALIRGYNEYRLGENTKDYVHFVMTGAIAASGSVMSLIDEIGLSKEIPRTSYFFQRLFINCTSLTQAPELPATTLSDACYCGMFSGCTGLTQAPELPATALASYCYWYMFSGCTGLTKAPELPATTTSVWCYDEMFSGCTNMSEIKVSFDDWSSQYPTIDWVKDVAPTGTFICPKALPLEYGVSRIPEGWTVQYIGEEGSGVSSALADGITVWTDGLTVYVRGAEGEVSLYDMSGKRVAVSNSADEERVLGVPAKGAYVVRTNGGSSVVLVR